MTEDDVLGNDWGDLSLDERARRLRLIADSVQPAPVEDARSREVLPFLEALLEERSRFGKAKYGTTLRTHNGRLALVDTLQECLDALQYLAQELMEREDEIAKLRRQLMGDEGQTGEMVVASQIDEERPCRQCQADRWVCDGCDHRYDAWRKERK